MRATLRPFGLSQNTHLNCKKSVKNKKARGSPLRSSLAETETKIATAPTAEKARLQHRAAVLREWLTPRQIADRVVN
jgi:hypothetical protein